MCFHCFCFGKRLRIMPCAMSNIINPAIKKRDTAITNGCADCSAIFVAVEAEAHKNAKAIPIQINFQFILKKLKFHIYLNCY